VTAGRLRAAGPEDATLLWDWANDSDTRAQAFRSEPISWESHRAWYAEKLADARTFIGIFESSEGCPLGQIRFDEGPEGVEVDVAIAPSWRGKGLAQGLVRHGLAVAARCWPVGTIVVAKVLTGNQCSYRLFTRCGFVDKGIQTSHGKTYAQLEGVLT